jgi:hypothetical protein
VNGGFGHRAAQSFKGTASCLVPGCGARHLIDARLELLGAEGSFEVQCGDSGLYFADNQTSREIETQHWPSHGNEVGGDLRLQLALTQAMIRSAESGEIVRL